MNRAAAVGWAWAVLAACGAAPAAAPPADRPVDPAAVTVFADRSLGPARQIEDFLGAGGAVTDQRIDTAWRAVGFRRTHTEPLNTEGEAAWIEVARGPDGRIRLDFTRYDREIERCVNVLGARPVVVLSDIPRVLSSQPDRDSTDDHLMYGASDYSAHMPRDLDEWRDLVRAVVRHNVDRGLRGLVYSTPGEPDFPGRFRYAPADDSSTQLPNHIRLYAATYRAVKEIDPTAAVGGPGTMNWRITPSTDIAAFALDDWLRALARWNAENPDEAAGLDYVSWQDYGWASERLSDGAEAVEAMLRANGFDPRTPRMFVGGGWGLWSTDYGTADTEMPHHRRASQIAMNLIREFRDPRERRFGPSLYYFFHTDDAWWTSDPATDEMFRRSALVRYDLDGREVRTPMFAAFQMAKAMADGGEIVETRSPEGVEAMAVRDPSTWRVLVWIANHSADPVTVPVEVRSATPRAATYRRVVRRIDEERSADGAGLEPGAEERPPAEDPIRFPLALGPYAVVQVALEAP